MMPSYRYAKMEYKNDMLLLLMAITTITLQSIAYPHEVQIFTVNDESLTMTSTGMSSIHCIAVYPDVGRNLILPCSSENYNKSFWEGPCLATNECLLNKTIYFDGLERNRVIPNSIFLQHDTQNMNGVYSLRISSFAAANVGVYTCFGLQNGTISDTKYLVLIKEQPSNIIIWNLTSEGTIPGTEDMPIHLVCELNSGLPDDRLALYKGFTQLKVGGPDRVTYSFIPTPQDNGLVISCVTQSTSLNVSMNTKAVLDIKYRPSAHFIKRKQQIIEGKKFVLQCLSEGNPPVNSTNINKDGQILTFCDQAICSLQLQGLRNESGTYTCLASNEIGTRKSLTKITVLYPPVVTVSLLANELHCNAAGVPNNATIVSWKHYTHGGTFLRMLEGSEYLTLSSSHPRYMINGLYVCEATNGIPYTNGETIATGNLSVKISGNPEILQKTKRVQFGRYNDLSTIQIFVHSNPPLVETKIVKNKTFVEKKRPLLQTYRYIKEHIFGKAVWIEGYTISIQIPSSSKKDFGNYTFFLSNAKGSESFTTTLTIKDDIDASDNNNGKLFLSEYVIGILVGSCLLSAVITGICVYFICTRRKSSMEIQRNETVENEPQYEEIYEMSYEGNNAIDEMNPVNEMDNEVMIVNEENNEPVANYLEPHHPDTSDEKFDSSSSTIEDTGIDSLPFPPTESGELPEETSDSEDSSVNSENFNSSLQTNLNTSYQPLVNRNPNENRNTGYDQLVPVTMPMCVSETTNV